MNRRKFIAKGTLAGISFPTLGIMGSSSSVETMMAGSPADFKLKEATIQDLQGKMQNGELTSRAITELYLNRVGAIDRKGPQLNAVLEENPEAMQLAEALDLERKSGKVRGLLHGIPLMVKDNIDTSDEMHTTAGAIALAGNIAEKDAFIISKLREAGAVVLGKTNLSEWANFRSTRSSSGWSGLGGQTRNPYVLDRSPCGSSSGSAVAVAANLCMVSIGTETNGSIVCPAAANGLVGIKPTVGLASRSGIIPISHTQDTAGPIARTVTDAAILLGALIGEDDFDAITRESRTKTFRDYTPFLDINGLKGKRIGMEKSFLKKHEAIDTLLQQAIATLKKQGATIVEVEVVQEFKKFTDQSFNILCYEFKDGVNKYLAGAHANVKSLADVIAFNRQHELEAMPFFKQEILERSNKLEDFGSKAYQNALSKQLSGTKAFIQKIMRSHKLDAISGPTSGPSCCIDLVNGDASTGYGFSTPAAVTGYPHITVPMGMVHNLPVGLSFFSEAYTEPGLIAIAFAFEQASCHRKAPEFLKTAVPF